MDEQIKNLLDAMPDTQPRSKLEPHEDVIRELRRKRKTYIQIAEFFGVHLGIRVAPSTVHAFLKVRDGRKKSTFSQERFPPSCSLPPEITDKKGGGMTDPIAAARQRRPPETAKPTGFAFDPETDNLQPIRKGHA